MNEEHTRASEAPIPETSTVEAPIVRPLTTLGFFFYVLHGIGVALGLCLLWIMEAVRNSIFRLLDRMNVPARVRKASAFPPGQPRKRPLTEASR